MKVRSLAILAVAAATWLATTESSALAWPVGGEVNTGLQSGSVVVSSNFSQSGGIGVATNTGEPSPWKYRYQTQCQRDDAAIGACTPGGQLCPEVPGRVISFYVVDRQRLASQDGAAVEGLAPPPAVAPGTGFGPFEITYTGCVDMTELNPAPTPAEVFAYFQTLPLPQLATSVQPPGGTVLVGLPTIFFTDAPTQQVFTVDIRGFTVAITAQARQFTWHTGDAAGSITSDGPGAPYPNQTVTHDYTSGTYTTYVTVTWGGTFTVDGSAPVEIGGTTTTDGPAVQLTAVQARAVLTNPYD